MIVKLVFQLCCLKEARKNKQLDDLRKHFENIIRLNSYTWITFYYFFKKNFVHVYCSIGRMVIVCSSANYPSPIWYDYIYILS